MGTLESSSAIKRLVDSGPEELSRLFEEQREHLREMLRKRLIGPLAARFDASDVIQEAFLRASNQLQNYMEDPKAHPILWIRLLCRQMLVEHFRKHMRLKRSPKLEAFSIGEQFLAESLANSIHSVSEKAARKELIENLHFFLQHNIDTLDREIIEMRHAEGLSFVEIAQLFELEMEAVKKRYYRALGEIRQVFATA